MSDENQGFTVKDRRRSSADASTETIEQAPKTEPEIPKIDFGTFLISLFSNTLIHLGELAEEEDAPPPPANLPLARQTIDIIDILRQKTKGNCTPEEEKLFENMLYELRMRYVAKVQASK